MLWKICDLNSEEPSVFADHGLVGGIAELAMKTYTMYFEQRRRGFDSGFCVKRNSLRVGRRRRMCSATLLLSPPLLNNLLRR